MPHSHLNDQICILLAFDLDMRQPRGLYSPKPNYALIFRFASRITIKLETGQPIDIDWKHQIDDTKDGH